MLEVENAIAKSLAPNSDLLNRVLTPLMSRGLFRQLRDSFFKAHLTARDLINVDVSRKMRTVFKTPPSIGLRTDAAHKVHKLVL